MGLAPGGGLRRGQAGRRPGGSGEVGKEQTGRRPGGAAAAPAPCAGGSRPKGGTACGPIPAPCRGMPRKRGPAGRGGFAGGGREAEAGGRHPAGTGRGRHGRGYLTVRPPQAGAGCGRPAGQPARRAGLGGGLRPPPTAAKPPALRACVLPIWQGAVSGGAFVLEPAQKFAEGAATLCILAADMIR